MRQLKFRAWDNHNKKWLMGYEYPNLGGFSLTGECVLLGEWSHCFDEFLFEKNGKKSEDLIIMQFTGLKDINGKDIYEGDIVICLSPDGRNTGANDHIIFKNASFWLKYRDTTIDNFINYTSRDGDDWNGEFEIIGNIYEQLQN